MSLILIYLFCYFFISAWTHEYVFHWVITSNYAIYFVVRIVPSLLPLALESTNYPKSSGSFHWKMVFRNQDTGVSCDSCYCSFTASKHSLVDELGNIYIYINCANPDIYMFVSAYLCIGMYKTKFSKS